MNDSMNFFGAQPHCTWSVSESIKKQNRKIIDKVGKLTLIVFFVEK